MKSYKNCDTTKQYFNKSKTFTGNKNIAINLCELWNIACSYRISYLKTLMSSYKHKGNSFADFSLKSIY